MNSRYMRPPPQQARMPKTPMMEPMQVPQMQMAPPPVVDPRPAMEGNQAMIGGISKLVSAGVGRATGEEPEAPEIQMPEVASVVGQPAEPAIPMAPPPAYGARPDPMQKKKASILESLFAGMA